MAPPLDGLTVLDLGDEALVLAGRLLGELGATVIRVEDARGDGVRWRGPFVAGERGIERSLCHLQYNAGKQSIALALDRTEAWAIVERLAGKVDVAIAPFQPSQLAAEFFGEERLRGRLPSLRVVDAVLRRNSVERAATDLIGVAAGGMLWLNGFPGDPPNHPAGQLAYKQVSIAAAFGALSMVLAGEPGGRITVSMQEAMMWTTIQTANENYWPWQGMAPARRGLGNVGGQTVFPARDGRSVSFYLHPPYWPQYARWVAETLGETRFLGSEWEDGMYRFEHNPEIVEVTARLCLTLDRDDLVREGQSRSLLVVPVQGVSDIAHDAHLRAREFFQPVFHPQLGMTIEMMRSPFISTANAPRARRAPALGEHTRSALTSAGGFALDEVDRLIASGIAVATQVEVPA